jgi:hypothetical protein
MSHRERSPRDYQLIRATLGIAVLGSLSDAVYRSSVKLGSLT